MKLRNLFKVFWRDEKFHFYLLAFVGIKDGKHDFFECHLAARLKFVPKFVIDEAAKDAEIDSEYKDVSCVSVSYLGYGTQSQFEGKNLKVKTMGKI